MNPACDLCHGEGLYLKDNTRIFCACADGQRRKSAWILGSEIVQEEARKDRVRRFRKVKRHDYKAEAAGREPGDDDVTF
jgi:hypothetical protein